MPIDVDQCPGGAMGSGGLGATPLGSGALLGLNHATSLTLNSTQVEFLGIPLQSAASGAADVLNPENWTLEALLPLTATVRIALSVVSLGAPGFNVFAVQWDGPLDSDAVYRITVANVTTIDGFPISGCTFAVFKALTFRSGQETGSPVPPTGQIQDIANPYLPQEASSEDLPPLGTYQINDRGDYALDTPEQGLQKRLFRRASTVESGFTHLPGYGFKIPPKELGRPSTFRNMGAKIKAQCEREPEVARVAVDVYRTTANPHILVVRIKAALKTGGVVSVQRTISTS